MAAKIESFQHTGSGHRVYARTVRNGRGRRHVVLADGAIPVAEQLLPNERSLDLVDTPQIDVIAIGDTQENVVAPDDRSGAGSAGHRQFPGDVFGGAPVNRKVFLGADAVEGRAPPLRPVFRPRGKRKDSKG